MRRVSNSEVGVWLTCQRKYFYSFDLGRAPKITNSIQSIKKPSTLEVGTFGHDVLAIYYEALRIGRPLDEALSDAREHMARLMISPINWRQEVVSHVATVLQRYWRHYAKADYDKYEILGVEQEYNLPLTDEFAYVFRLDLLLKIRGTTKIELWDHKFKYDFFSPEEISLTGQMPKYLGALRHNGIWPEAVRINQIRALTRAPTSSWTDKDYFTRTPVVPSNAKIKRAMTEQIIASQEISEWRELPIETRRASAKRAMDAFPSPCVKCPFNLPCRMEYDGGNIELLLDKDFGPNSYDYNRDNRI